MVLALWHVLGMVQRQRIGWYALKALRKGVRTRRKGEDRTNNFHAFFAIGRACHRESGYGLTLPGIQ